MSARYLTALIAFLVGPASFAAAGLFSSSPPSSAAAAASTPVTFGYTRNFRSEVSRSRPAPPTTVVVLPVVPPELPPSVARPAARPATGPPAATYVRGWHKGYATAEACVSWTENGGDYGRSRNPSHFGRYQFSTGSWAANGGNPADWGSASPAEQDAVFATAWAKGYAYQYSQWLRWDGC